MTKVLNIIRLDLCHSRHDGTDVVTSYPAVLVEFDKYPTPSIEAIKEAMDEACEGVEDKRG